MSKIFIAGILNPKGIIALQQREIILTTVLLILIAVIPAYVLFFIFARKYRASNPNNTKPVEDNHSTRWVLLFWLLPTAVVVMISLTTWKTTHTLDPYKKIASNNPPLEIQVVALDWKWLFIYPEQHIATVNFIQVPVNTPLHFDLTADAPMNSFWIPELGGQMYAMTGMSSQLNLMASELGDFQGSAAEVNGQGFAGMQFTVRSSTEEDFTRWVASVQAGTSTLNMDTYTALAKPSEYNPVTFYSSVDQNMYNEIIGKFMPHMSTTSTSGTAPTTNQDMNENMNSMDMSN